MTIKNTIPRGAADKRIQKLFPSDWLEICALANDGKKPKEIAEIYDVDDSIIYKGLKKRQVNVTAIAQRKLREESEQNKKNLLEKIKQTKELDYNFTLFLQKEVISFISQAKREDKPVSTQYDNIKTIKVALDVIKAGTDNKWRLLGLDKENENADLALPELPITEMSQDEVELMREQQEESLGKTEEELELMIVNSEALNNSVEDDEDTIVEYD